MSTFLTEKHLFRTILAHQVGFLLGSVSQLCYHHDTVIRSHYDSKLNFTPSTPLIIPQDMRRRLIRCLMKRHRSVDSFLHKPSLASYSLRSLHAKFALLISILLSLVTLRPWVTILGGSALVANEDRFLRELQEQRQRRLKGEARTRRPRSGRSGGNGSVHRRCSWASV